MRYNDIKPKRSVATKQMMATRRLYDTEVKLIEKVWDMRRPRSLKSLQATLDLLWDHYGGKPGRKPTLRFGPGTKYHGTYYSFTRDTSPGQEIELAPGQRNFYVLIHEMVHALGPSQHGLRFAEVYRDLLRHDTFHDMMSTPEGELFLHYLDFEHPYHVRRAYKNR